MTDVERMQYALREIRWAIASYKKGHRYAESSMGMIVDAMGVLGGVNLEGPNPRAWVVNLPNPEGDAA